MFCFYFFYADRYTGGLLVLALNPFDVVTTRMYLEDIILYYVIL